MRGEPSTEPGGTDSRTGTSYREYNAGELSQESRLDDDPVSGRPREMTYRADRGTKLRNGEASERQFTRDGTVEAAQSRSSAYEDSGYDRSHLAQREAFKQNGFLEKDGLPTVNKLDNIPTPQETSGHFTNVCQRMRSFRVGLRETICRLGAAYLLTSENIRYATTPKTTRRPISEIMSG